MVLIKKIFGKITRAAQLCYNFIFTNKTRILTVKVIALSGWYRFRIRFIPMAKLQKTFGEIGKKSPETEDITVLRAARLIGARVERVCKKTSWDSKCLVQALVAQNLLHKKNIHTTLYLGLRKEDGNMHAHAWLRCGQLYVTGGIGDENHTIVSYFYR